MMDALTFWLNFIGYVLQVLGLIAGAFGYISQRIFDFQYLQALINFVQRFVLRNFTLGEVITNPFLRSFFALDQPLSQYGYDTRYNRWDLFLALLLVTSIYLFLTLGFYIALMLSIFSAIHINKTLLMNWFIALLVLNFLSAIGQVVITWFFHLRRLDSASRFILEFIRRFFLNWILPVLIAVLFEAILLLEIIMNWVAWITNLLPDRWHIDIASKPRREKYYVGYSVVALTIGTVFLFIAFLSSH